MPTFNNQKYLRMNISKQQDILILFLLRNIMSFKELDFETEFSLWLIGIFCSIYSFKMERFMAACVKF